jgi:hypothetical protein
VSGDIGLVASTSSAPAGYTSYVDLDIEIKTDHKGWNFIRQDVEIEKVRNIIHNGAFDHFQRTSGINPIVTNSYVADRFRVTASNPSAGQVNMRNSTYTTTLGSPSNVPEELHGDSSRSLAMTCGATYSPTATQVWGLVQSIEAREFNLYGKKAVISFYVQSNHAATYTCTLNSNDVNTYREYKAFSVQPGWQRINMVYDIPTFDEIAWNEGSDAALGVIIELSPGSSQVVADNTRVVGSVQSTRGTIGQDNFFDTIGNELRFNGFMMYEFEGDFVDFKRAGSDVADELRICQRYCVQHNFNNANNYIGHYRDFGSPGGAFTIDIPVPLRAFPVTTQGLNLTAQVATSGQSTTITSISTRDYNNSHVYCNCNLTAEISGAVGVVENVSGGFIRIEADY